MRRNWGLFSEFFHRRDEADARAASWSLGSGHFNGAFRSGATAILFRTIIACAFLARDIDFFGHGLITWDFFLDDLDHAAFAACVNFFSYDVVVTSFHLNGFSAMTRTETRASKHGTARGKTKGDGDQGEKLKEFFHVMDEVGFRLE